MVLEAAEQMVGRAVQAYAEFMNRLKGRVDLSALNEPDLPEIQAAFFGQFFLGQAQFEAGIANIATKGS
jgi:hypothetical protein